MGRQVLCDTGPPHNRRPKNRIAAIIKGYLIVQKAVQTNGQQSSLMPEANIYHSHESSPVKPTRNPTGESAVLQFPLYRQ